MPAGCFLAALMLAGCAAAPELPPSTERSPSSVHRAPGMPRAAPPAGEERAATVEGRTVQEASPQESPTRTEEQLIASVPVENSVFFERGSAEIGENGVANLRLHAERLKSNPKERVTLIGYTENLGSRAYSVAIAAKRVEAVSSMLRKFGVPIGQIRQRIAGVERNGKACNSEKCRRLMRRVELRYAKPRKTMTRSVPASRFSDSFSLAPPGK